MNGFVSYLYKVIITILINDLSGIVGDSNCNTELLPRLLLRCNLLENYLGKPVQISSTKVYVNTTIFPIDMDFQEDMQSLEVTLWMNMTWKDENLVWNPKDVGINSFFIECDEIWTPVLSSLDRRKIDDTYVGVFCELSYDGIVKRTVTKTFENTCYNGLDFTMWPFDEHRCSVFIGVPQTSNLDINFRVQEFEMHNFGKDTAWIVEVVQPPLVIHPIKRFEMQFKLKRPRLVQGTVIIFTTMFLTCLELGGLMLQIEKEERLLLMGGVTFMLSFFLMYFSYLLPPTGTQTPHLINYYFFMIVISTFNITWSIIGRILLNLNVRSERITTAMERISSSSVFRLIMFDSENKIQFLSEIVEDEEAPPSTFQTKSCSYCKEFVKLIDRIVLLAASICIIFLKVFYFPHMSEYQLNYELFNKQDVGST